MNIKNAKTNRMSAGFTDQERAKMTELLAAGFADSFRAVSYTHLDVYKRQAL